MYLHKPIITILINAKILTSLVVSLAVAVVPSYSFNNY